MGVNRLLLSLRRDGAYATRTIAKNPGVTLAVVLSISLGIAANTTVFSLTNALMFGSLPVPEPDRVISIDEGISKSWVEYTEFLEQNTSFEDISARWILLPVSIGGGEPERIWGQLVTANYFNVLGLRPVLGRGFLPDEGEIGDPHQVTILSDALWRRRFGAEPEIVGREVIFNNRKFTVIGVLPPGFQGQDRGFLAEFWVPMSVSPLLMSEFGSQTDRFEKRGNRWLALTGKLKPNVSIQQAEAEMNAIRDRNDEEIKSGQRRRRAMKLVEAGELPGGAGRYMLGLTVVMMIVVGLVLLIACANVANILLARAAGRQKEIGIRLAMGASRRRLVGQLLTESVLLALMGAGVGILLSYLATSTLSRIRLPIPLPVALDFRPDGPVLAVTAALSVLTGLIFGLAPALRATNPDLVSVLKGQVAGMGGVRRFGLRNALVVVQVSLSLILLISAGLFLRSLRNASSIDLGMNPENVLILGFDTNLHSYSNEQTKQFLARLRNRVTTLPGVQSVSFTDIVPLSLGGVTSSFSADTPTDDREKRVQADMFSVSTRFFETMGIDVVQGREFTREADASRPTVILNESLAERLFPGQNPVGRQLAGYKGTLYEIVGVAQNSKMRTLGEEQRYGVYRFLDRAPGVSNVFFGYSLLVRTAGNPEGLMRAVHQQFRELDPNLAVFGVETMREHVHKALLLPRVSAILLGVFGVVGLALAMIGLYGVMSYSVRRRTREIGIRMALGAPAAKVLRTVVWQGMILTGIGLAAGLAVSAAVGRLYSSQLYEVSGTDLLTFVTVPTVLTVIALTASVVPAKRAAGVHPSVALRDE